MYQVPDVHFYCMAFMLMPRFFLFCNAILFIGSTSVIDTSLISCNLLPKITTSSAYAVIGLHLSYIVPIVSTLDLLIAISNTTLNSRGATASPCLKHFLSLNAEDK